MTDQKISDDDLAEYKEVFSLYDQDGAGYIRSNNLGRTLRILGQNLTESELQDIIQQYDINGDGQIDFPEFCQMLTILKRQTYNENELDMAFKVFDKTSCGYITLEDLQEVLTHLGEHFTDEYIEEIFNEADQDSDGVISFEDFLMIMR